MNPNDQFKNCFGIFHRMIPVPKEIILSFDPFNGNYIKSYPLHKSQKILIDDDKELRIRLYLHETYDFIMELLSYGDNLQIIQPQSLIDVIKEKIKNMNRIYNIT